jgi:branched-chain amino acid transport system permease protein
MIDAMRLATSSGVILLHSPAPQCRAQRLLREGINFTLIVLVTFALGSAVAAFAGVMNGLYYSEINFGMGLLLGVIGFSAAIVGGLGNIYGAILGGFLFAALQTVGAVALPFASAYKDVFAFAVVIAIMAWRPTGLIAEKTSERV